MTSNTNTAHRLLASLKLPEKVPALITYAQSIVKGMTVDVDVDVVGDGDGDVNDLAQRLEGHARWKGMLSFTNQGEIQAIAVDATSVYWTSPSAVLKASKCGGEVTTLATSPPGSHQSRHPPRFLRMLRRSPCLTMPIAPPRRARRPRTARRAPWRRRASFRAAPSERPPDGRLRVSW